MTTFTLGEATTLALGRIRVKAPARRGAPYPIGVPVRRDSIEAGTFEGLFFAVPAMGEPDRLLRAARAALDAGRRLKRSVRAEGLVLSPTEAAMAALTAGAVRIYEELCTLARLNAGRVFPSYDRLAAATALGRATVARALAALERAGFLVRQRRFKRVEGNGSGPRYEQTSNAYRPTLPTRLMAHLPRRLRPAPLPADVVQHAEERAEALVTMHAALGCRELAREAIGGALGRALANLGAAIDAKAERESHISPETLPDSISQKRGIAPAENLPQPSHTSRLYPHDSTSGNFRASATPPRCSLTEPSSSGSARSRAWHHRCINA